jgi:hypothetical protein
VRPVNRDRNDKNRTLPERAADRDYRAECDCIPTYDCETEAHSAMSPDARIRQLSAQLECSRDLFGVDTGSGVADRQFDCRADIGRYGLADCDCDAAFFGKLDRVDSQVEQDRLNRPAPRANHGRRGFEVIFNLKVLGVVGGLERGSKLRNQLVGVDILLPRRLGHRVRKRKVHYILNRLREVVRVGVRALEDVLMTAVQLLAELVAKDVQVAEQGLNRRAQFMGQVGQRFQMYSLFPIVGRCVLRLEIMRRVAGRREGEENRI